MSTIREEPVVRAMTAYDEVQLCNEHTCRRTASHIAYAPTARLGVIPVVSCDEHLPMMREAIGLVGTVEPTIEEAPRND